MNGHLYTVPPAPKSLNPNLPEFLSRATERALLKDPSQRFRNANDFRNALHLASPEPAATQLRPATNPGHMEPSCPPPSAPPTRPTSSNAQIPIEEVTRQLAVLYRSDGAPRCEKAGPRLQHGRTTVSGSRERDLLARGTRPVSSVFPPLAPGMLVFLHTVISTGSGGGSG